jgi:putative redox protein
MGKPPLTASLSWTGELTFSASSGSQQITLDSKGITGPSPMQTLAFGIAGCMAMDVVDILRKGRHPFTALEVVFAGERAEMPPRRFTSVTLTFLVHGHVAEDVVRRAIALSHERYCSVSNSLRGDIVFTTKVEVRP